MSEEAVTLSPEEVARAEELIQDQLEEAQKALEEEKKKQEALLDDLAHNITTKYRDRAARRGVKEQGWLRALNYYLGPLALGEYTKPADAPFHRPTTKKRPDRNIVYTKCEIAKAQILSMQFGGDEKNFELMPPSSPDIPDAVERARRMEDTMADQLEECNYKQEIYKAVDDFVVLGTFILKGPINMTKLRKRYIQEMSSTGQTVWVPEIYEAKVPEIKAVNLWYAFPDDSVTCLEDIADFIELHPMAKSEFMDLKKNSGFIEEAILEACKIGPQDYVSESFTDYTSITDSNPSALRNKYLVLEYHGPIPKKSLDTLEMEAPYDVPEGQDYYGEVWVCNGKVIRIALEMIEGCFKPPYSGDVWQKDPGSPFGFGVAEKLADAQRVVTQAWHMILDNASASSAPQVVINQEMIEPADGEYEIKPKKIWYYTDISGNVQNAFDFFSTPNVTADLFPVMESARNSAEEESGIALLSAALQSPEVGSDTATGQAIMSRAATVLLDQKSDSLDINGILPRLKALYDWNMQYNPDESIKADMTVKIRLATTYRNKQLHIRDMEKLSVEAAQNPETLKHLNMNNLIRSKLAMMNLPTGDIVKPLEQVLEEERMAAENPPPPAPDMIKAMNDTKRLELEERRLALEEQKVGMEANLMQQREQWEHEERMVATYARIAESEASIVKSQNEKEIALLQLAAKSEDEAEKRRLTAGIQLMNNETKQSIAGLQASQQARKNLLMERELELAENTGSGV